MSQIRIQAKWDIVLKRRAGNGAMQEVHKVYWMELANLGAK